MTIQNPNRFAGSRQARPQDWLLALAAIWLFISPWVLGFSSAVSNTAAAGPVVDGSRAAWDAWVLGAIVFLVAVAQATSFTPARFQERWVNVILGIWIFVAPWALGFTSLSNAAWDHWVIGVVTFVLAAAKYARNPSVDVPLASEPGLPLRTEPTLSPLADEPGAIPPAGSIRPGNVNVPPDQRKAGGQR